MTFAASCVSPIRPSGILCLSSREYSSQLNSGASFCHFFMIWSLLIRPMHTVLTRMPYCPRSLLIAFVIAIPAARETVVGREEAGEIGRASCREREEICDGGRAVEEKTEGENIEQERKEAERG